MGSLVGTFLLTHMLFGSSFSAPSVQDPARQPVPSSGEKREAQKLLKDIFNAEYAKRGAKDKQDLAKKLLAQAKDSQDDPVTLYVLLEEAHELSAEGGDLETAFLAIDQLAEAFSVDPLELKSEVLGTVGKKARTPTQLERLASAYFEFIAEAMRADAYSEAEKAHRSLSSAARKLRDLALVNRVRALDKEIDARKRAYRDVERARGTLEKNADDPRANLALGKYLVFGKGDWKKGLVHLAKGSDDDLKKLAAADLGDPTEGAAQVAVADGWWELSEKVESGKAEVLERALLWYEKAAKGTTGLQLAKVEKRLASVRKARLFQGTWIGRADVAMWGQPTDGESVVLSAPKGQIATTNRIDFTDGPFDGMSVRFRYPDAGSRAATVKLEGETKAIWVDPGTNLFAYATLVGQQFVAQFKVFHKATDEYTLTVLIEDGEYVFYVNFAEIRRVATTATEIGNLGFQVVSGKVLVDQIQLRKAK